MRIFIQIPVEKSPTQPLEKIKNINYVITEVLSDKVYLFMYIYIIIMIMMLDNLKKLKTKWENLKVGHIQTLLQPSGPVRVSWLFGYLGYQ
jgi:hypothetical protein